MKKSYLLFSVLFCLETGATMAQYTILHTFNDTAGAFPAGELTLSGKVFYGMTNGGGANALGCIFSMDTTGANFKDIFDFSGTNGAYPQGGSLKLSGNKLFGMTFGGGANDSGCVFSIDTNGAAYKDLLDFTGPNGAEPYGSLTLSGKKLFGLTYTGGANMMGNIFTIDTNGNNYKDLLDFNGANGANPYGDLTIIGDKLYSMTDGGALNSNGNIFSIDSNGANYTDLFDFNGTNGAYANNLLTLGGSQFFAVTNGGGVNTFGNVFSIDTAGSAFKDLFDFAGVTSPDGQYPIGDVILSGNILYGLATGGGANDSGCIYSVDTNGNNYTDMFDFNGPNGNGPYSNVTTLGSYLYGTTSAGGANGAGVIFKYNLLGAGINNMKNNTSVKLYPNPNNGQFTLQIWSYEAGINNMEIYDALGEQIYSQSNIPIAIGNTQTINIDLSNQPDGVYLYRAVSANGELIGQGKLIIQK